MINIYAATAAVGADPWRRPDTPAAWPRQYQFGVRTISLLRQASEGRRKTLTLRSVWLQELTWEDVRDYLKEKDTIMIPFGTTEQHGPAGPLGLDGYVAIGLAEDAAREAGVLVAPPLWYG
ncbi:MAG: creatininase family protein, partial [Acidobacteria bacterium]|nr:creatininase family protein [Acidobacteriota bacterium]